MLGVPNLGRALMRLHGPKPQPCSPINLSFYAYAKAVRNIDTARAPRAAWKRRSCTHPASRAHSITRKRLLGVEAASVEHFQLSLRNAQLLLPSVRAYRARLGGGFVRTAVRAHSRLRWMTLGT